MLVFAAGDRCGSGSAWQARSPTVLFGRWFEVIARVTAGCLNVSCSQKRHAASLGAPAAEQRLGAPRSPFRFANPLLFVFSRCCSSTPATALPTSSAIAPAWTRCGCQRASSLATSGNARSNDQLKSRLTRCVLCDWQGASGRWRDFGH